MIRRCAFCLFSVVFMSLLVAGCQGKLDIAAEELVQKIESIKDDELAPEDFFREVGSSPHKVVELGDRRYWYFNCTDGRIVLTVDADRLEDPGEVALEAGIRILE